MKELRLLYTNIQHSVRRDLEISCLEYVLIDMIYHLSTKPDSAVRGWCYMSKDSIALEIGITKQGLLNMIERLEKSDLLERNIETKFLRTTKKYFSRLFTDGKQSLLGGKQSLPEGSKQSLPEAVNKVDPIIREYNNSINNNTYKESGEFSKNENYTPPQNGKDLEIEDLKKEIESLKEKKENERKKVAVKKEKVLFVPEIGRVYEKGQGDGELHSMLAEYYREGSVRYDNGMYKSFLEHWTETVRTGKGKGGELWRSRETFSVGLRLSTWNKIENKNKTQNNNGKSNSNSNENWEQFALDAMALATAHLE